VRRIYDGLFDRGAKPARPRGSASCLAAYDKRMEALGRVGHWRKGPAKYKTNDGSFIDPDWYIIDW